MNEIEEKFLRIGTQIYRQEINPSGQEQLLPGQLQPSIKIMAKIVATRL